MKTIWNYITPLKDKEMTEYLGLILKPFDISDPKVVTTAILAIVTAVITNFNYVSVNYLGISGKFAAMLLIILIADLVTGILAANEKAKEKKDIIKRKEANGEIITEEDKEDTRLSSKKGRRTLYKTGAYVFFIYVGFSLQGEIDQSNTLFIEVLKYFHPFLLIHITFWELFSIDENLKAMGTNVGITTLLKNTYENFKNIFNKIGKKDNE